MRIKRLLINRYGPVKETDIRFREGLQVIYGKNEAGKTLTIDAMIKMMVGQGNCGFEGIDRVGESPDGFIIFEVDRDIELKADISRPLLGSVDTDSLDLRNILIIRNSDLELFDQQYYLKEITDRLTGLQTERIDIIIKKLADFGRLTNPSSSASLSKKKEFLKAGILRQNAYDLSRQFNDYIENARSAGHDELEIELMEIKEKYSALKGSIDMIEKSRTFINYKKNRELIGELKENFETFKRLDDFDDALKERVTDLSRGIGVYTEALQEDLGLAGKLEVEIEKDRQEYETLDREVRDLERKKSKLEGIKTQIEALQADRTETQDGMSRKVFLILAVMLVVFSGISFLVFWLIQVPLFQIVIPLLFFAAFLVFIILFGISGRKGKTLRSKKIKIIDEINLLGIRAGSLKEAQNGISGFYDIYEKLVARRDEAANALKVARMSHANTAEKIKGLKKEISRKESVLKELLDSRSVKDIGEFELKYRERNKAYNDVMSSCSVLAKDSFLDIEPIKDEDIYDLDRLVHEWEDKIEENKPGDIDDEAMADISFSKAEFEEKTTDLEKLENKKKATELELREHEERLASYDRSFRLLKLEDFLDEDLDISISNLDRLGQALQILKRFMKKIDQEFDIAIKAIAVFEEIRSEEDTKIGELFNDLDVSRYFGKICSGRYSSVYFDPGVLSIKVLEENGKELEAKNLSKGTLDQLYLSVRLALADRLFRDKPGFFVFDDPLLASDSQRTKNQFDIIRGFCEKGWQIIYFTVKEEICRLAESYSSDSIIKL